jgi:gliding motility-associated-like protein
MKTFILFLSNLICCSTFSQQNFKTNQNISGIVNSYTPVLAFNPCNNQITVEDGTTFNPGDTVLIIQMQGAVIDSSNTATFGNVTDYRNSGNYEFNYVKSKSGNIIELQNVITRQYDIPTGKVQLIRVPYYNSVTVTSTLTCLPWDGSKGGVLVFNVKDTLTLQSNLDVKGKGFRGGVMHNSKINTFTCAPNDYYFPDNTVFAAGKGESIAFLSSLRNSGRGKKASGGGGGLDPNTGGGGGGNGNVGGLGGYGYGLCPGYSTNNTWGLGGLPLNYNTSVNKIFLAGGGGAGHCNNGFSDPTVNTDFNGGNGGGLVIISSNFIEGNNKNILANGDTAYELNAPGFLAHDGMGGGGAGGTVLLNNNVYLSNLNVKVFGGKGGNMSSSITGGQVGPGGGGAGGVVWFKQNILPPNVVVTNSGGNGGIIIQNSNPYGATAGSAGINVFNLTVPVDAVPFKKNIDSVKINYTTTSCSSFTFNGLGYSNTNAIALWQWNFGDGQTANTQSATHVYITSGQYVVKLVITDINGCKDSATINVNAGGASYDFSYKQDVCNPYSVQFLHTIVQGVAPYWSFGDGVALSGNIPLHVYPGAGNYTVKFSMPNGCPDTLVKVIALNIFPANIITTNDTSICTSLKLQAVTALSYCWSPTTFLDSPKIATPTTTTPQDITYYLNAEIAGTNVIVNGDFSNGNTGFTSEYAFANPNITEGQYFVGPNPQAWNPSLSPCKDHTSASGNMLLVNGSPTPDVNVWKQVVAVTPNTNYAFSTWIQALWPPNPAQLQFAINGQAVGSMITASLPTCTWSQFYTTWNSGNSTTATISIVNKNTQVQGNDFALGDISFAPVLIKRDSVKITMNKPNVKTNNDTTVCVGTNIQLTATGAVNYSWSPVSGLSNPNISNPVATINNPVNYIVTGTNASGCVAKDTVSISVFTKPNITISNDTSVCKNQSLQLSASGGSSYLWSPSTGLSNPNIPNPIATTQNSITYFVNITDANSCVYKDSVIITVGSASVFSVSPDQGVCASSSKQLTASGGDYYLWQPSSSLSNPNISNPVATPTVTTTYSVKIKNNSCGDSAILTTTLNVLPSPQVNASKSNDIDCSNSTSQLNATGAIRYLWSPGNLLTDSTVSNPVAQPLATTLFMVTGTDVNGCKNVDTITIFSSNSNGSLFNMPNAFTPNNDGLNDCFGLKYWGNVIKLEFSIYNRFGERIFYTTNPMKCWDGTYKGVIQGIGSYVYMIKATTACDTVERKGIIMLVR